MYTKYYNITITDTEKKMQAERKRRRIIRRRIRKVCVAVGLIAFLYLFGITGGVEQNLMSIKEYVVHSVAALFVMLMSVEIGKI